MASLLNRNTVPRRAARKAAAVKAQFLNGEPVNLPAAALDALEWLEWLHGYSGRTQRVFRYHTDSQARLARAIQALKKELEPHLPHVHLDANEMSDDAPEEGEE